MSNSITPAKAALERRAHELLLMSEVMRLVGKSLAHGAQARQLPQFPAAL